MKLESIRLNAPSRWDKWTGYRGEVVFDGPLGKVQINVDGELSRRILEICADELVAAAQEVATNMTAEILSAADVPETAALEAPVQ